MEWVITNVDLLQHDGAVAPNRDVMIRDDRIAAIKVHPGLAEWENGRRIDGNGKLMIPGLINAHFHSHDRFDKGRFDNLPLELWMVRYNSPLGRRVWTPEDCYLRTLLCCTEQIRSGVTTVIDDVFHGDIRLRENIDAVYQAYQDSGLRAMVTAACSDLPYQRTIPFLEEKLPESLRSELSAKAPETADIFDLWSRLADRHTGRVAFAVSTSAPQRCSDAFLQEATRFGRELGLPVFTHVLETKVQEVTGRLYYGASLVEHLDRLGLLGPDLRLIHGVWLSDGDVELIAEKGAKVIHNPLSNLKLGSGIAPVAKLLARGIPVGLGTDNNNCNDSVNMIEAMKTAALVGKVKTERYHDWVGAGDAFAMATTGGAECFGSGEIGELKAGGKADFSLFDLDSPAFFPPHNRLYQLVFGENGRSLDTVVVDGRVVMEQGRVLSVDEKSLSRRLAGRRDAILKVIDESSTRAGELAEYVASAYEQCMGCGEASSPEGS